MDAHGHFLGRALYFDERDAAVLEAFLEIVTDKKIFVNIIRHFVSGKPVRRPGFRNAEPQAYGMRFLTHRILL
jgi:hypothetical protein